MKWNLWFFVSALSIILLDQLTKNLIRYSVVVGQNYMITSWLFITHTGNTGALFSILRGQNILLTLVTIGVIGGILYYYKTFDHPLLSLGFGLVLGGGVGNLIDRVFFGAVTDFIGVGWWPIFNVADSAVVVGVVLLVVYYWKYDK